MRVEEYKQGDHIVAVKDVLGEEERLIARAGTKGQVINVWDDPDEEFGQILDVEWDAQAEYSSLYVLTTLDPITKVNGQLYSN